MIRMVIGCVAVVALLLVGAAPVRGASPSPTPSPTATPVPAPAAGELRINEVLPNPVGTDTGNEWIELMNVSGHAVNAGSVTVVRASGTTLLTVPSGTTIEAGEVKLFTSLSSSIVNSGDTLVLKLALLELDRITYDDTGAEGSSWARTSASEGVWTTSPTPGEPNIVAEPAPDPEADPGGGSGSSTSAGTKSTTSAASAKSTSPAKKATASKLPKSGPDAGPYVLPLTLAMLYAYRRLNT